MVVAETSHYHHIVEAPDLTAGSETRIAMDRTPWISKISGSECPYQ
jgi:hypothetical protein